MAASISAPEVSLAHFLNRETLDRLAGAETAASAQSLIKSGQVENVKEKSGTVLGSVQDGREFRVQLWVADGQLDFVCNCPSGGKGAFCEHCAAVGLKWLEEKPKGTKRRGKAKSRSMLDDISSYLALEDKTTIVGLLLGYANSDPDLQQTLWFAAIGSGLLKRDRSSFQQAIEKVVRRKRFSNSETGAQYARKIQPIVDALEEFLEAGEASDVVALTEFALAELNDSFYMVSRNEDRIFEITEHLFDLHHRACVMAKPDPAVLAGWLLDWQLNARLEQSPALEEYADVLGEQGLATYRKAVEAEWAKVSVLKPREYRDFSNNTRFRITKIMEQLADESGDLEFKVSVLQRDLSSANTFMRIAQLYSDAGQHEKALSWAKEGLQAFNHEHDIFKVFIARQHQFLGQTEQALAMVWRRYQSTPGAHTYSDLHEFASSVNQWPKWREKALGMLREKTAKEDAERERHPHKYYWLDQTREQLVRILLWEGDVQAALEQIRNRQISGHLLLQVADKLAEKNPEDALKIYSRLIGPTLQLANNSAYKEAIGLLRKMSALMTNLDRAREFITLVLTLRKQHSAKRNFITLMDKEGWK